MSDTNTNPTGDTPFDFRPLLPEDIRTDPVWDPIKVKDQAEFIQTVGKGYVHAQRSIGTARLPVPQKDWKPEDWAKFNKTLGVPEKPEDYATPDFKFNKGLELVPESLAKYKALFHTLGLRPDQAAKLQQAYFEDINGTFAEREQQRVANQGESALKLKEMFGDKTQAKLDIATTVLKKFGTEELLSTMTEAGLTGNPDFVKFLSTIGEGIMDDNAGGAGDGGFDAGPRANALQEIGALKGNTEFQKRLNDRSNPGHAEAVAQWTNLHKAAYPD